MLLRNEAKVGSLIFVAVIAIIAMYWFLRGFGLGAASYDIYSIFANAHKLDKGADVRMAGVKIGSVEDIALTADSHARVDMTIWNGVRIPTDSRARITTGGFIGDNYVDVVAGRKSDNIKNHNRLWNEEPMNYDKLISDVGDLVDELKVSVKSINGILSDTRTIADIKSAIHQLNLATVAATDLVRSARVMVDSTAPGVSKTLANMTEATENAMKITKDLDAMVSGDVKPETQEILKQARMAMTSLNDATSEAKGILSAVGGSVGKLDQTLAKVDATAQQSQEMMANMNVASKGFRDLATDEQIKQNIKSTMQNAADASAEAKALLATLNKKLSKFTGPSDRTSAPVYTIPNKGLATDSLWNVTEGDYRFDANYTLGGFGGGRDFYRIGAFNIGERMRGNLQIGTMATDSTALRYGIYASRLGFGVDQQIGKRFLLSGDLFRPNDPQYDLRGTLNLSKGFGLYGGVSNVLGGQDVFTGIHYTK